MNKAYEFDIETATKITSIEQKFNDAQVEISK